MSASFAKDVAPLFTDRDAHCMDGAGVHLREYAYMASPAGDAVFADYANARHVLARLKGIETPRMPPGGSPWSDGQIALFESWMTAWLP